MSRQELYERMSRLIDGALPPDEAEALRREIDADPALAVALETMTGIGDRIAALPEEPPPPALDRAALATAQRITGTETNVVRIHRSWAWVAVAASIALAALLLWPRPEPTIVLVQGSQWVEGQVLVMAASVPVRVDGTVLISVEPSDTSLREMDQEVIMRNRELLLGALAGAAVTVAVYEGSAVLFPGEANSRTLDAGQTETVVDPDPDRAPTSARGTARTGTAEKRKPAFVPVPAKPTPIDEDFERIEAPADEIEDERVDLGLDVALDDEDTVPEVLFPTSKEGINDAIREELGEIRECYQAWLELQPELEGTIEVKFVISDVDGVGEVTRTETLDATSTDHTLFEGCVLNVMSDLTFEPPEDGGVVIVSYPFQFSSE